MSMTPEKWQAIQQLAQTEPRWANGVRDLERLNREIDTAQRALDIAVRRYRQAEEAMAWNLEMEEES